MNKTMDLQFEAWARKMSMDLEYRNIPGVGQFYECPRTLLALEAWQASRESLVIELPIPKELCGPDGSYMEYFEPEQIERAIEAAGLKVKP